jgi:hypothetical protein
MLAAEVARIPPQPAAIGIYWGVNTNEVGWFLNSLRSTWLSQLLEPGNQPALFDALVTASQVWTVALHCNKGLAGGAADAVRRTADTSMNPACSSCHDHTQVGSHVPDRPAGTEARSFPLLRAESIEHLYDGAAFGGDDREVIHVDQPSPALFAGATGTSSRG